MGGAPRGLGGPGTLGGSQKGVWRGDTPPPRSLWGQVTGDGAVLRCPWGGSGGIWGGRLFPAAQSLRVQWVLGGSHGVWGGGFGVHRGGFGFSGSIFGASGGVLGTLGLFLVSTPHFGVLSSIFGVTGGVWSPWVHFGGHWGELGVPGCCFEVPVSILGVTGGAWGSLGTVLGSRCLFWGSTGGIWGSRVRF